MKCALITGVTGQDGSYLAELLLSKGYEVHGLVRRASMMNRSRIDHIYNHKEVYNKTFFLHYCDLEDVTTVRRIILKVLPREIYHLAGQSHVKLSFEIPESTCESSGLSTLRLLEIIRDMPEPARFFHAASSEIFGSPKTRPQTEETPIAPLTPYGCAKALGFHLVQTYRAGYGLFACNGILYNHESPRRGENFVTRKITRSVAEIKCGLRNELLLGNLDARRDWGYAREYVEAMWLMLQQERAEDFLISTGETHSVKEWVEAAFAAAGLEMERYVKKDPALLRPTDPEYLVGNPAKAKKLLGWNPSTKFHELVRIMVEADLEEIRKKR